MFEESELDFKEVDLIKSHKCKFSDLYDGRGQTWSQRRTGAKEADQILILRDAANSDCGHRITTRQNHCITCNPAALGFYRRHRKSGFVYIAGSPSAKAVKVGYSEYNPWERAKTLNNGKYGGLDDWIILFHVEVDEGGNVEAATHTLLSHHRHNVNYHKDGGSQMATEIFKCDFQTAYQSIAKAMQKLGFKPKAGSRPYRNSLDVKRYNF